MIHKWWSHTNTCVEISQSLQTKSKQINTLKFPMIFNENYTRTLLHITLLHITLLYEFFCIGLLNPVLKEWQGATEKAPQPPRREQMRGDRCFYFTHVFFSWAVLIAYMENSCKFVKKHINLKISRFTVDQFLLSG